VDPSKRSLLSTYTTGIGVGIVGVCFFIKIDMMVNVKKNEGRKSEMGWSYKGKPCSRNKEMP
jgi:hypothetical protein